MRVLLQRVSRAAVRVDGAPVAAIGRGYLLFVGITHGDAVEHAEWMAEKVHGLRLFPDATGRFDRALEDVGGAVLVVSQFTLYGDPSRGRRPSFVHAARPELAAALYDRFCDALRGRGLRVETGRFGAMMEVELVNDGPVTLWVER